MADRKGKGQEKKGPEWNVRISSNPNRLRRDTAFLCNIRYKNDLPEIPCDPKLILPPYDKHKLSAFKLTELEKDLKKDLMFDEDLGIPIHPWNIEQYSIPDVVPPLHHDDAALLESDEEEKSKTNRLRGDAAEISWLLRTKYIAAEAGVKREGGASKAAAAAAAAAAAGAENEDPREQRIRQIQAQFLGAKAPLVHAKDPSIVPVEVMPVFPDSLMKDRELVLANFDNDPLADVSLVEGLPPELRARVPQTMQLKSFKPPDPQPQFVALMLPRNMPELGDDELTARGCMPRKKLYREYQWVREYRPYARLDDKCTTYLFRFADDGTVQFHDLNTRLELRKRKRQATVANDDEGNKFHQPEKVVVRDPETGEWAEQQAALASAAGNGHQQNGAAGSSGDEQQQQEQEQQQEEEEEGEEAGEAGAAGGGGGRGSDEEMADAQAAVASVDEENEGSRERPGGEEGDEFGGRADANAALRDVFGSDDDDI